MLQVPVNLLINGVGQELSNCTVEGSYLVTPVCTQCRGEACSYAYVAADPSAVPLCSSSVPSRQIIRIFNVAGFAVIDFSIDGHLLGIVGADSNDVEEVMVSRIRLNAAQR
jgi:hypothetical protein